MKYVPPYGNSDPNAPYVNGDPSIARQGSIPPAEAFEHPMREIVNIISKNNIVPSSSDLDQMVEATRSQYVNYAIDTGSVNVLSVAYDPPIGKYNLGLPLRVRVANTNTGGVTIDAGAGRVVVKRPDGSNIVAGDMPAGGIVDLVFDGTAFQMVNYLGGVSGGDIINNFSNIPYAVDTSPVANQIIAPFSPAITSLAAGDLVLVKVANTVTAATTLQVNALTPKSVKVGTENLLQNDITATDIKLFIFDGTSFQLSAPNPLMTNGMTLNVPSQYPTVEAALLSIGRKILAENVQVVVQLGLGIVPRFGIRHRQADRITVQGTMKAAPPTIGNFAITGADDVARNNDASTNIVMLRTRYGTEIWVNANETAIWVDCNSGAPKVKDILVVGNRADNGSVAVSCGPGQTIYATNIASWGIGFVAQWCSGGRFSSTACISIAGYAGANASQGGVITANGDIILSNNLNGLNADWNGEWQGTSCNIRCNKYDGLNVWGHSLIVVQYSNVTSNGRYDFASTQNSLLLYGQVAASTSSPYFNTEGNMGAWVAGG